MSCRPRRLSGSVLVFTLCASACDPLGELEDRATGATERTPDTGTTSLGAGPDDDTTGSTDGASPHAGAGSASPTGVVQPQAPRLTVSLDVGVHTVVVLGSVAAEARFEWQTSADGQPLRPGDATVSIQMKTETDPVWRDVLTALEPNDVAAYSLPAYASQSFWFRAVAAPTGGGEAAYSPILRVD